MKPRMKKLVKQYQTDRDSGYHKLRYHVRISHDQMLRRIVAKHGRDRLRSVKARTLLSWHKDWSGNGQKLAMGHAFIGQLRTLFAFGATILEDRECERLCAILHKMRFPTPKPRTERLTTEQAIAVRAWAHKLLWSSIAIAQAFQFELMLRQKDVIGEWVPLIEPGVSAILRGDLKWLMGLLWSEIDDNFILRHNTSKLGKDLEVDLRLAMNQIDLKLAGTHFMHEGVTGNAHSVHAAVDVLEKGSQPVARADAERRKT